MWKDTSGPCHGMKIVFINSSRKGSWLTHCLAYSCQFTLVFLFKYFSEVFSPLCFSTIIIMRNTVLGA